MRQILDKFWAISLDDMEPNNVELEVLCEMLMNEAKNRYPLHQRIIQFMRAKRAPNEKHGEWIERLRTLTEVAELEHITVDELGIHVFIESADQTMSKLAIDELEKKTPSLKRLTNAVKGMEASQWYNPNSQKGYSKAATASSKQCGKCDAKGHTSRCTFCGWQV